MKKEDFRKTLKRIITDVISDIRSIALPLIILAAYLISSRLIFGEFCPMKIIFHIPCPACGLTHAGARLLVLDLRGACEYNPCIYLWAPLLLIMLIRRYILRKDMKKLYPLISAVILLTIAVYLLRIALHVPS